MQWDGNDIYNNFSNTTTFNVEKINTNTTIILPNNPKINEIINITGVVTDEFGNPIANITINVEINGKTYSVTPDVNGKWSLEYRPTHTGNITITVTWEGNNLYFGFTNTTSFIVEGRHNITPKNLVNNHTNNHTENVVGMVAMKETGVPINVILLVILTMLGVLIGRKQN